MQDVISAPVSSLSSRNSTDHTDSPFNAALPFTNLDNLAHELRQPLSAIEHLAFYLELVSSDPAIGAHAQRIQDLVGEANRILEKALTADCGCCSNL